MARSLTAWSILLSAVAQVLLYNILCLCFFSLPVMPMTVVGEMFRLISAGFHTEACRKRRVIEAGLHL
jgi:hypothetical protein